MNKEQKQEVIETLKTKFSQYSNFYITDTQNLSVAQITNLRRHCFDKQVEMKVAKNTLIKKALESLDNDRYSGVYDSLHQVTALMFSDSPKEPALIISSFRKSLHGEKPLLKAAFLNGDIFVGDNQLVALTKIKTKNELIGEVIGLLMSPIQRVIGALQNRFETTEATDLKAEPTDIKAETKESKTQITPVIEAKETKPVVEAPKPKATESKAEVTAVVESKETEPVADAAKPKATESKAETTPAIEAKETEPVAGAIKPEATPIAEKTRPKATESKADVTPVIEAKKAEPVAETKAAENKADEAPVIEAKKTEPVAETKATESKADESPVIEAKETEPEAGAAKPGAKGTETQPEP